MENTFVWLFLSLVFLQLCQNSQSQLVPALHIFGDSAVDVGNSFYLNTSFKADFAPYGIDFVVGQSGRFSNGDLITDTLAAALGLELPYAIVNGTNTVNFFYNDNQAFNYAYGTAGILPETGEAMGETLGLGQQIRLFKEIVKTHLPQQFNSSEQVFRYISDSFFAVFVGSNDYIHNYLQPKSYNSSRQYKFDEFAELLVKQYGDQLSELQSLGAKRMVVFEIPPIGCYPIVLENVKSNTRCAENVNNMVSIFNDELGEKVKELSSTLKDSTIILAKTYGLVYDMVNNSSAYGFEEAAEPCCVVGKDGSGLCEPDKTPCEKRNTTLFWDQAHISQAASEKIAMEVFNGSGFTMPVNMVDAIKSGAAKPPTSESEPPTSISEPPASDSEPPTSNSESPASDSEPPTSDSEPPTPEHSGAKPSSVSYFNLLMFSAFSAVLSYL